MGDEFKLYNPFTPPDALLTDYYEVYTTKGTLARVSAMAQAYFGFGQKKVYTTHLPRADAASDYRSSDYFNQWDGDLSCETGDNNAWRVTNGTAAGLRSSGLTSVGTGLVLGASLTVPTTACTANAAATNVPLVTTTAQSEGRNALVTTTCASDGSTFTAVVTSSGAGYAVGDVVSILGGTVTGVSSDTALTALTAAQVQSALGLATASNPTDLGGAITTGIELVSTASGGNTGLTCSGTKCVDAGATTFYNVASTDSGGSGTGALFTVVVTGTGGGGGTVTSIICTDGGSGYVPSTAGLTIDDADISDADTTDLDFVPPATSFYNVYENVEASTDLVGTGAKFRVVTAGTGVLGSEVKSVQVTSPGWNYANGEVLTFATSAIGDGVGTAVTITIVTAEIANSFTYTPY